MKGSVYSFFYIFVLFQSCFLAYLETAIISCYAFSERLKFAVFKLDQIAFKNFNEEEHEQSENEEFEAFERVIFLLL